MRRYLLLCGRVGLTAGLVGALVLGSSGCAKIESRDLIREGNAFYNDGQYSAAIEKYNASLEKEPDGVTVLWNRACAAEALVLQLKSPDQKEQQQHYADMALRDFQTWYERLDESERNAEVEATEGAAEGETPDATKKEKTVAELLEEHRLAIWRAAGRCDDLKAHWLEKQRQNPKDEKFYIAVARQHEDCGDTEQADAWYVKRTEDFPESVKAWHALALRKYDPLWPDPESGLAYNENLPPSERIRYADEVIKYLDKATSLEPKFRDAYVWRSMAYAQRQNARVLIDEPELPEERLEAILAREDAMLAWKNQKAICDIEELPECPSQPAEPAEPAKAAEGEAAAEPAKEEVPQGPCCPPAPITAEEQAADAEAKQKLLAEIEAAAQAEAEPKNRRNKRKNKR